MTERRYWKSLSIALLLGAACGKPVEPDPILMVSDGGTFALQSIGPTALPYAVEQDHEWIVSATMDLPVNHGPWIYTENRRRVFPGLDSTFSYVTVGGSWSVDATTVHLEGGGQDVWVGPLVGDGFSVLYYGSNPPRLYRRAKP